MKPEIERQNARVRRGLVLAGGGALGGYTVGCLKSLERHGITFDAVAGTSAGALNAIIAASNCKDRLNHGERLWCSVAMEQFASSRLKLIHRLGLPLNKLVPMLAAFPFVASVLVGRKIPRAKLACPYTFTTVLLALLPAISVLLLLGWSGWLPALVLAIFALFWMARASARGEPIRHSIGLFSILLACSIVVGTLTYVGFAMALVVAVICFALWAAFRFVAQWLSRMAYADGKLRNENLKAIVIEFLERNPPEHPVFVTVAYEALIFDPDDPRWDIDDPPDFGDLDRLYRPVLSRFCVPAYVSINGKDVSDAAQFVIASTALPLGIFNSVPISIDGQRIWAMDGGLVDNHPILPLISLGLDEILVISLDPDPHDPVFRLPIESPERMSRLDRLQRVAKFSPDMHPTSSPEYLRADPPRRIPFRAFDNLPDVRIFLPPEPVGDWTGLLRFEASYVTSLIETGERDMTEWLGKGRDYTGP
jgi:predicted acylesterase/phospholipase RssA